jgi:hypothetical protein
MVIMKIIFLVHAVLMRGKWGRRRTEKELGWTRKTSRKGIKNLQTGCVYREVSPSTAMERPKKN